MQVRLLGPVDAEVDGVHRPIPGKRRSTLVAVLALHPGERNSSTGANRRSPTNRRRTATGNAPHLRWRASGCQSRLTESNR
jgi:hypothetical protein